MCLVLVPEPIVDGGVVRRWLWRLAPRISLDFFGHRVSSFDVRFAFAARVSGSRTARCAKVNEYLFEERPARTCERIAALPVLSTRGSGQTHVPFGR